MLSTIVAIANNNVIGKDNKLIWHLPEDLKRFKQITTGKNIIMGRKTFESLGRVLPNRKHIILCNDMEMDIDNENVEILVEKLEKISDKTIMFFRPRKFGKTLFTSTLECYYDINKQDRFNELFQNIYIGKNPTKNKNK